MKIPILLSLSLAIVGPLPSDSAQTDETVLGKPSAIRPPTEVQETVALETGARLHEQPRFDSPTLEILTTPLELPVLDRRGPWVKVRFGVWQGWVLPAGEAPQTPQDLAVSFGPDEERLLRARLLLGVAGQPRTLGPFTLYSDVVDEELLEWLSVVAQDVFRAYRERFGLDPGHQTVEAVVLFAEEADYRAYEAAEARIAQSDSRGYTSKGLSVLFVGEHGRTSLVSVFVHELTHLLNQRVFRTAIPPWLEEGMAEDLAFCQVTDKGRLRLGSVAGEIVPQGLQDSPTQTGALELMEVSTLTGAKAHLAALLSSWQGSIPPDLAQLTSLSWEDFSRPENRTLRYTASAMLLRFLADGGDPELKLALRRYLEAMVAADPIPPTSIWPALGTSPRKVEPGLYRFVLSQAQANGFG